MIYSDNITACDKNFSVVVLRMSYAIVGKLKRTRRRQITAQLVLRWLHNVAEFEVSNIENTGTGQVMGELGKRNVYLYLFIYLDLLLCLT